MAEHADHQPVSTAGVIPASIPAAPWRIRAVSVLGPYRLAVTFNDGVQGVVDLVDLVNGEDPGIFAPLKNPDYFSQVFLDFGALTWPNGADLAPEWMHDEVRQNGIWVVEP